ncbi:PEP-CTERM sorting domain-containing protein [Pseudoduganella violaceinigra]|uniref:PEP-CTERM sorting domain-containing protein n=1 Tax=Pseudoduganella violaceinigra TaxID=246602 RepID=UPI001376B7B7|nr:PEP-CTERM sorting domain-containing protein [Pseudoduganella violaceinigra]
MSALKDCRLAIAGLGLALLAATASADVIFNNFKGPNADAYTEEYREAEFVFGTVLNSLNDTTIKQIGVRWQLLQDTNVKFLIWESGLGGLYGSLDWPGGSNSLLYSQTKFFTAGSSLDFIYSDPLSFSFEANKRYDIGIAFESGAAIGSWDVVNGCSAVNTAQGGFESINRNANISDYSSPRSDNGYACVDPHIQLLGDRPQGSANEVPEGVTLALLPLGLVGMALVRRRRAPATTLLQAAPTQQQPRRA